MLICASDYEYLGSGTDTLNELVEGTSKFFAKLKRAKKPVIIVGQGALSRADGKGVMASVASLAYAVGAIKDGWNGLGILHTAASRVGGLDLGFVPGLNGVDAATQVATMDVLFLLGADELDLSKKGANLTVYIGSHGDNGASNADVILPGAAYVEKAGIFVNTEGRVQYAQTRDLCAGRCTRRLGDHPRAFRHPWQAPAVRLTGAASRQIVRRSSAFRR